jgi:hypothetical protein
MEKDVGKIPKNPDTDIIIRIDDFGGRRGLTIREFVSGERYTGFTKAGTRIPVEQFKAFKDMINGIDEAEIMADMPVSEGSGEGGGQSGLSGGGQSGMSGGGGASNSGQRENSTSGSSEEGGDTSSGGIEEKEM